jgi:hypothetical protein
MRKKTSRSDSRDRDYGRHQDRDYHGQDRSRRDHDYGPRYRGGY